MSFQSEPQTAIRRHLLAFLILAGFAWLYLHRLDAWLINDDEEEFLYAAWRIGLGEVPYRDFLTAQLPAFLYPGGLIVRLFGNDVWALRAWSAGLTLLAGAMTYLAGRRLFGAAAGLAAMVVLLADEEVFQIARAFRPEATMLALGTAALYVFVRADEDRRRAGYVAASLLFGAGFLAKLFGLLPWAGTLAAVGWDAGVGRRSWRGAAVDMSALAAPGLALFGAVMGVFWWITPYTSTAVLGHHLAQGQGLTRIEILHKNLSFFGGVLGTYAAVLVFVPLGLLAIRRINPARGWVAAWHLPTLTAFLVLSRELWTRHLVYVVPALALVAGAAIEGLVRALERDRRMAALTAATLALALAVPPLLNDADRTGQTEIGTARLAMAVRALTPPDGRIVSASPGIAFYAGRATSYSGAGISEGAIETGQITGARLLGEIDAGGVSLVLIDQSADNSQLADMPDVDAFRSGLARDFDHLGHFFRHYQRQAVYARRDPETPRLAVDFGWASLVALDAGAGRIESGGRLPVSLVFQVRTPADRPYTAFAHLVGGDGARWGGDDRLLDNAISRSTEEWEPGELAAAPLAVAVEPGTPPGRYRLRAGLYDAATGRRLAWTAPDRGTGDAWDAGEIEVVAPARPPDASSAAFRAAFGGDDVAWIDAPAGPYRPLAVRRPPRATAGMPIAVRLTWQAARAPGADQRVRLRLTRADGRVVADDVLDPGGSAFPTSRWRAGEVVATRALLVVDPDAPAGPARLAATILGAGDRAVGPAIDLGAIDIDALPAPRLDAPAMDRRIDARFGPDVALLGADLPADARPGSDVAMTLFWQAARPVRASYTVLVHVVPLGTAEGAEGIGRGAAGAGGVGRAAASAGGPDEVDLPAIPDTIAPMAQGDGIPADGARPTTSWRRGEVIADSRRIPLPDDLPPGRYAVLAGLYDAADPAYARLPASVGGVDAPGGRVAVGAVTVGR